MVLNAALLAAFCFAAFLVLRGTEQFRVAFRKERLLMVRGTLPQSLLNDFADTLRRAGIQHATLVGRRTESGLRLTARGVSEWDLQRLRNQLGHHPFSRLQGSGKQARRTLGTLLGITWLAWLLAKPEDFS